MISDKKESIQKIVDFCEKQNLKIEEAKKIKDSSFRGIKIQNGGNIQFSQEVTIGDLIHEVAHIACFPKKYQHLIRKNKESPFINFDKAIEKILILEHPKSNGLYLPEIEYYDEATVGGYSYLLALDLGIDPRLSYEFDSTGSEDDQSRSYKETMMSIETSLKKKSQHVMLTYLYYGGWIENKNSSKLLRYTC